MSKRFNIIILFILEFTCPCVTFSKIVKGPYLAIPQQSSMVIFWESDLFEEATIKYGETASLLKFLKILPIDSSHNFYLYSAHITNLKPARKYFYQIIMTNAESIISHFKTAPLKTTPIHFVAMGDSRTGHEIHQKISNAIDSLSPHLIINMGDLVRDGGKFEQWGPHYFQPAANLIDHIPSIPTLGDHDTVIDDGEIFNYYFRYNDSYQQLWFSYDYGPAHFVSLDYRAENDSLMIQWFERDMEQSDRKWNFVYLHRPSYNIGGHRTNWGAGIWPELYRKYKVDIIFAGHSHLYERFYPMRPSGEPEALPVTYITTGGAGAELYESVDHEYLAFTKSVNHFILVKLSQDSLYFTALLPDMNVLDRFIVVKKDGQYDSSYLSLVKQQETMDVHMIFASKLLIRFNQFPTATVPAIKEVEFVSKGVNEDISFKVYLSEVSAQNYWIEPFEGILKKGQSYKGSIKLYAKDTYTINDRYFEPPVLLNVRYETSFTSGIAEGRQSRYYPPEDKY